MSGDALCPSTDADFSQASGISKWMDLVCSVYSAIIHFLYSNSIILNLLESKCRRIGSRRNGTKNLVDMSRKIWSGARIGPPGPK